MPERVDISALVEERGRGRFIVLLLLMVSAAACLEGFDAQIQGYTAPALIKLWHVSQTRFSIVFVSFQLGFLVGAVLLAQLGDRIGRRTIIVSHLFLFGLFTVAGGLVDTIPALAVTRFVSAIFMGAAVPNAIALVIDYSPKAKRAQRVSILYVVYAGGSSLGGFLAAWMVPAFGWQSLYWTCGALASVYSLVLFLFLPESLAFLVQRRKEPKKIAALVRQLAPDIGAAAQSEFFVAQPPADKAWVGELFTHRRALMTISLWAAYMANMVGLHFATNWMPTIFASANISYAKSVVAASLFQGGGAIGSLACGWLLDRQRGIVKLAGVSFLAVPILAGLGFAAGAALPLMLLAIAAGFCVIGCQTGLNGLSGFLYPSGLRATGAGWANGVGRIGAIGGPVIGALILDLHLPLSTVFLFAAIPSLCVGALALCVSATRTAD